MSIAKKKGRTWEDNLEALKLYKAKNGDPHVPAEYSEDPTLAAWARRQRQNHAKLSEEQRNQLVEVGFTFENPAKARLEAQWTTNYLKLKQYAEEHGDCKIPKKYTKDPSLGSWSHDQRQVFRRGGLSKERVEKLRSIGYELQTKELVQRNTTKDDEKWKEKYQKLVAFKEEHGHANCPQRYSEDKSLGIWVDTQRQQYARNLIKEERKKLLDEIGFTWKREAKKSPAVKTPTNNASTPRTAKSSSAVSAVRRTSDFAKINGFVRQIRDLGNDALKEFEEMAEHFLEDKKKRKKESEVESENDPKKQKVVADDEQEEASSKPKEIADGHEETEIKDGQEETEIKQDGQEEEDDEEEVSSVQVV